MTLRQAFVGQVAGIMGASICRWLIWPLANGETGLVVSMMPFIIAGSFLLAHRHTASVGFDYNMAVLLLLQPAWPLSGSFMHFLTASTAVLLGPAIGLLAFLSIFPVDGQRRLRTLVAMMLREVETMADRRGVSQHRSVWRARLHHRVLRLVRWADKNGTAREEVIEASLAILLSGSAIAHIDEVLRKPELASRAVRSLKVARTRLRKLASDPHRAARSLAAAARLCRSSRVDVNLLQEAAAKLSDRSAPSARCWPWRPDHLTTPWPQWETASTPTMRTTMPARHAAVGSNHAVVKSSVEAYFGDERTELVELVSTENHFHPSYLSPVWRKCV
jgi:hypothetical protein